MTKKRIFIIGSCVSRDLFELTDKYEITEYVARTSLASAFDDKPFPVASNDLLEETIESNWQRKCVRYDTHKLLRGLLKEKQYDAILLDFVDERFGIMKYNERIATVSYEFKRTDLQNKKGIKLFKPSSLRLRHQWKKGIEEIVAIAKSKNIPVFLNEVYPAFHDEKKVDFNKKYISTLSSYLDWFYRHTPQYIQKFSIPKHLFVSDTQHKWGRDPFHYKNEVYEILLGHLDKALADSDFSSLCFNTVKNLAYGFKKCAGLISNKNCIAFVSGITGKTVFNDAEIKAQSIKWLSDN